MTNEEKNSATAAPIRERWLNGWHRRGDSVLMGTAYHCAGCGAFLGLGCVAFDGTPLPEKEPDFPFEQATCPLCQLRRVPDPPDGVDKLTERLERLRKRDSDTAAVEEEREACASLCEEACIDVGCGALEAEGVGRRTRNALAKAIRARGAENEHRSKRIMLGCEQSAIDPDNFGRYCADHKI